MTRTKATGSHKEKRLSAAFVRNANAAGFYGDGHGLYLKVEAGGAKRWVQRLLINGKRRDIGLGAAGLVTLVEAREQALENRRLARAGGDPIAAKRRSTAILTFEEAARKVHGLRTPTWKNAKHGQQWLNTMEAFVFDRIGPKRIDTIDSADILAVLEPIWSSKMETARRVKQRLSTVMHWAKAQGWRTDNPVDGITMGLVKQDRSKAKHHTALPYIEVPAALNKVKGSDAGETTKLAFEFLVLTASRSGETRQARWSEVDMENRVWTIPAERMKAKRIHRIPLSDRCIIILQDAKPFKRADEYLFPGSKADRPLSDMTLSKLIKELKIAAVPYGFRSSFRDWAAEQTSYPNDVCEFALAHVVGDRAEAAYKRTDLFEKRRALMNEWAEYCR